MPSSRRLTIASRQQPLPDGLVHWRRPMPPLARSRARRRGSSLDAVDGLVRGEPAPQLRQMVQLQNSMAWQPGDAVLLGAGASAEAGVPTSYAMTERIFEGIATRASSSAIRDAAALSFIRATLIADQSARGNPSQELHVEHLFSAVQLLAERSALEVTPFVASWHPAIDALDSRDAADHSFDSEFIAALSHTFAGSGASGGFHRLIAQLVDDRIAARGNGRAYERLAELMLAQLRDLVATTEKEVGYLRPLVARGAEPDGITVATLNYDRSVEIAGLDQRVPVHTGVTSWIESGTWRWPRPGIRLLKLHGSIDWSWKPENRPGFLPRKVVAVDSNEQERGEPAVVFGHRGKLRAEGPFLSLLAEFEAQLASAGRLVVIGYSFGDDHVNEVVRRWTAENSDRKLLVVDPHWPTSRSDPGDFRSLLNARLTSYGVHHAGDPAPFEDRLEVWRIKCGEALDRLAS